MKLNQYQVIVVNLDPTVGSEIKKTRPCVIISPDEMNKHIRTVVVAPLTSTSKSYPSRIKINFQNRESWIAIDQIRTIDKKRVMHTLGYISDLEILKIKQIIKETFVD
jgi:mRNA interferase MazF